MCIIVVKKTGVEMPDRRIIENCFENNPDGAGFMYRQKKGVVIEKGFFDVDHYIKTLTKHKFTKKDTVVLHFRIATHGEISQEQCHPFPLTTDVNEMGRIRNKVPIALAHNGIISTMPKRGLMSDTMVFIQTIMSDPLIYNNLHNYAIRTLIEEVTFGSKLAVLSASGLWLSGRYIEHKGLLFSNDGYLPPVVQYSSWPRRKSKKRSKKTQTTTSDYGDNYVNWDEAIRDEEMYLKALYAFLDATTNNNACVFCGNHWKGCDCGTIAEEIEQYFTEDMKQWLVTEILTATDSLWLELNWRHYDTKNSGN